MRTILRTMLLRHLARYATRPWHSWPKAVNAAVMITTVWFAATIVLGMTVALVAVSELLRMPLRLPVRSPWLYFLPMLPLFVVCDRYIERMAADFGEPISPSILAPFNTRKQRLIRWAQAMSIPLMLLATVGLLHIAAD